MTSHVLLALGFGVSISLLSYRMKLLTRGGALVQCVLGTLLFALGGWQWVVPIMAFFLPSSVLSHIGRQGKRDAEQFFAKGGRRDALQVIANGGIGGVLVVCWYIDTHIAWFIAYLGALATASADTWGTEIGTLSRYAPVLITTGKGVERGVSGGISLLGSGAALIGAVTVTLSGLVWVPKDLAGRVFLIVGGVGTCGAFLDSLLGATFQMQFLCPACHRITERTVHCGVAGTLNKGIRGVDNDIVNLVSTWATAGVALAVFLCSSK